MAVKPFRFDSRRRTLVLAIGLLLASILVAAALLQKSSDTKVYLVANRDLAAGTELTANDVQIAELSLGTAQGVYLSKFTTGTTLSSSVPAGELIPISATLESLTADIKPVRIKPTEPLSSRIRVGSLVQLWFVPKAQGLAQSSVAIKLLGNTKVLAIHRGEQSMGQTIDDLEIAVPSDSLSAVITAIASAGYVSVVSEG